MSVIAIDTHEMVKELKAAGFSDAQAEAVTRMLRSSREIDVSSLAGKTDLRETELRLGADLRQTELKLEAKIETAKADIIKWMFGTARIFQP